MADLKISQLSSGSAPDGTESVEAVQSGGNVKLTTQQIADFVVTREFDRAWDSALLFDKNEIHYEEHELTTDVEFSLIATGHIENKFSVIVQEIITDGTHEVTFSGFKYVLGDVQSGTIPESGTHIVFFLYFNGVATVNWSIPTSEVANLIPLSAPANFAAVADGSDEIDLSWDTVANVSSYELYYSLTGTGAWTLLSSPAAGATSASHTGLTEGTTLFYRIRAIGDLIAFSHSQYSTASATTETAGDVTAPTFEFSPTSGATDPPVNIPIILTANEPIRNADGSELTNGNVDSVLRVKETNVGGANIPFSATIDASKTIITIIPDVHWGGTQLVYVDIDNVEDVNGNEVASPISSTFTTTDFTLAENNYLSLATLLDAFIEGADKNFELELVIKNATLSGIRTFFAKATGSGTQFSFVWQSNNSDIFFRIYGGIGIDSGSRTLTWANALTSAEQKVTLKYFGAIDTNDGLDRADLYIDDVLVGGKVLTGTGIFPIDINSNSSPLWIGRQFSQIKDIEFRSNFGADIELTIPIMRDGLDTSGNARHGTWIP